MLRMEIALILVLGFVAYIYYSAERTQTALHRTFSALLAAVAAFGSEERFDAWYAQLMDELNELAAQ